MEEAKTTFNLSIIGIVLGVVLIIISQTVKFEKQGSVDFFGGRMSMPTVSEDSTTKNFILFSGLALLAGGGIMLSKEKKLF